MLSADFCVIGAGIVGLATARALQERHPGASVTVLEKEPVIAKHQTGHNSGVIHSGIYYEPGSLKARLCREGERLTKQLCRDHGIEYRECGKLLVATSDVELSRLVSLAERAAIHGIPVESVSADRLNELEPNIRGLGALRVPSTGIVDFSKVSEQLARNIAEAGGAVVLGERVVDIVEYPDHVAVQMDAEDYRFGALVACGGLQADRLAECAGLTPDLQIVPFRGEYFQLHDDLSDYVRHLIYPVPDPALPFLGVHLSPTIDDVITVGPSAVLGLAREGYPKFSVRPEDVARYLRFPGLWKLAGKHLGTGFREMRNSLFSASYLRECRKYAPGLELDDLIPKEAGIRAQAVRTDGTLLHDFELAETPRMMHVLNAPSPAATAALPIGRYIAGRVGGRQS
ncbi:L-2-hydroxyglutarate oxidase [Saxibacter everestensis]|uniref:L-2-hydroxyglutarate oxidase n=1 Tax=Saxibacter everestensis TaxID=2909229 RepID=A0ABY8R0B6_9MICO|nr:L-2-hydroxyglutarate oxidase [Brevibacteriaceae bacterium ZFBP1038]